MINRTTSSTKTSTMSNGDGLRLLAPAKINLALEILRRRPDGFHEIATVMTTLDLADRVSLWPRAEGAGLEVVLTGAYAAGIDPADDLAGRAATRMAEVLGRSPNVRIEVEKRIPSPGGLGGGSSDAAAVLRGLTRLWGVDWQPGRLEALATKIGSDVPFFLHGGTAFCSGRGEVVEPLKDLRPMRMLLLIPPVPQRASKTAFRYASVHPHDFSDGHRTHRLAQRIARNAPPPTADLINTFEAVVERSEPELIAHYAKYHAAGAPRLHLCGSGPAVFMLVLEGAKLQELRRAFRTQGANVIEAHTLPRAAALAVEVLPAGGPTGGKA